MGDADEVPAKRRYAGVGDGNAWRNTGRSR